MLKLKNNLRYDDLSAFFHSPENPIEIFKELLEKEDSDYRLGYDKIVNGDYRTIYGFRLLHENVAYGPIDVVDLEFVKEPEYQESSKKAHDALEELKSKGVFDFNVEIPAEYNVRGRTWRQFYEGVELGALNICRKEILESALRSNRHHRKELVKLGYGKKKIKKHILDEADIIAKFESIRKPYIHLVDKIPVYNERIFQTLSALKYNYNLVNFDYHPYNVIINSETDTIIIIDGYWKQMSTLI